MDTHQLPLSFLEEVRSLDDKSDWKRGALQIEAERLLERCQRVTLECELPLADLLEAQGRIHVYSGNAAEAIAAFLLMAQADPTRGPLAYSKIKNVLIYWGSYISALRGRTSPQEAEEVKRRVERIFRNVCRIQPGNSDTIGLLALYLKHSGRLSDSLDLLADDNNFKRSEALEALYYQLLIEFVLKKVNADAVSRVAALFQTQESLENLDFTSHIFLFHRSVVFHSFLASIEANPNFGTPAFRNLIVELCSRPPFQRPQYFLDRVLSFLGADQKLPILASRLFTICENDKIWNGLYEGHDAIKQHLIRELLNLSHRIKPADITLLSGVLFRTVNFLPQTCRFWEEEEFKNDMTEEVDRGLALLPTPQGALHRGLLAFGQGDLERIEKHFREVGGMVGYLHGYHTYLDPRDVRLPAEEVVGNPFDREGSTIQFLPAPADAPPPGDRTPIILTTADPKYMHRYAASFAQGVTRVWPGGALHFHVIGDIKDVSAHFDDIRMKNPSLTISVSFEIPAINRPYYFACARFVRAEALLKHLDRPIVMTDIDVHLVRSPLEFHKELGESADVGLRVFDAVRVMEIVSSGEMVLRYPRLRPWECISAECLVLNNTDGGLLFSQILGRQTKRHLLAKETDEKSNWCIDQNILTAVYLAIREHSLPIRIANIEEVATPYAPYKRPGNAELRRAIGKHWFGRV